ncbi:hypothetical protein ACFL1R_00500 [Candidatus Latescibacterota bacterium]
MVKHWLLFLTLFAVSSAATAQNEDRGFQLHPKQYERGVDVDAKMFIGDWRDSIYRVKFGSLVIRDIFTPNLSGNPLKPSGKGEVLEVYKEFAQCFLAANTITTPTTLAGEQAVFYVTAGTAQISAGDRIYCLEIGSAALVPADLEFTLKSGPDEELSMLMVIEPIVGDFTPRKDLFVRNGKNSHYASSGHWSNISVPLIGKDDGLCVMHSFFEVLIMPHKIARPHASLGLGTDVNWYCVEGDWTNLGKQIWKFRPGMAFKNPSDGRVYHSNINTSEKPIKFIHIRSESPQSLYGKYMGEQKRDEFYALHGNPDANVDTDMFVHSWKHKEPRIEHGAIRVSDIFTENTSEDPLKPEKKGAVLDVFSEYAWGVLEPGESTTKETLWGEQKVFYFTGGEGEVTGGKDTVQFNGYTGVLIPEGLSFQIKNTGNKSLTMLILGEKTYKGFKPRKDMLVIKEGEKPLSGTYSHWNNINKPIFGKNNGMARLVGFGAVWLSPATMAQLHASRGLGTDVLWLALEGDIWSVLGQTLYRLERGMAFKNPSDGLIYHGNINTTENMIKLLWTRSISPEQAENLGK